MKKINIPEDSIVADGFLKMQSYTEMLFALVKPIGSVDDKGCLIVKSDSLSEVIMSIHYHDLHSKLTSVIVDLDFIYGDIAEAINFGIFAKEFRKPIVIRTNHIGTIYDRRLEYYQRYARRPQGEAALYEYNYEPPSYYGNPDWLEIASKVPSIMQERMKNDLSTNI